MERDTVLKSLRRYLNSPREQEDTHLAADCYLLCLIDDPEITEAFFDLTWRKRGQEDK